MRSAAARRDDFFDAIGKAPLVMGILNLTPDSFSDGGLFLTPQVALAQASKLASEGCAILDIGAESTRPGAMPVEAGEQIARLAPVLPRLAEQIDIPFSIDTSNAAVAAFALGHGAILVNDVWGLQKDPALAGEIARAEAGLVITHNRLETDRDIDILADIRRFFDRSLALAASADIDRRRILLDPGIGFGKTSRQNIAALRGISALADYDLPILVGASRKRFLGSLGDGSEAGLAGGLAVNLVAAAQGAAIFRVHDVAWHVAGLRVFAAIETAG